MFEYKYKDEMNNIRPDDYIKQKVLNNIKKGAKPRKTVAKKVTISAVTAFAASFAIVFSIFGLNSVKQGQVPVTQNNDSSNNSAKKESYNEVYSALENALPKNTDGFWELYEYTEDNVIAEEALTDAEAPAANNGVNTGASANKGQSAATDANGSAKPDNVGNDDHSETTTQVEGVKEADIVKTDGEYIYSISFIDSEFRIIKAGRKPKIMSVTKITKDKYVNLYEMYLVDEKIVILGEDSTNGLNATATTLAYIYDVTNPDKPKKANVCKQSGRYYDSRLIGDKLYLISDYTLRTDKVEKEKPKTFVPEIESSNFNGIVKPDDIIIDKENISPKYTVIGGYSVKDGKMISSKSLLGNIYTVYCSTENIIIAGYSENNVTKISRFAVSDGKIEKKADGKIDGSLLNQFSIDEYKGNYRFVTTKYRERRVKHKSVVSYETITVNSLVVLNGKLKEIGCIDNVAPNERVYSVRFMGDVAYFVTFRETDPLFSVDLTDPKNPEIIGKLKIPGFSNYLYPYGEGKLLGIGEEINEWSGNNMGVKLSMFDVSDSSDVSEEAKKVIDSYYSQALYDHKAILADGEKNIIGFSAETDGGLKYYVFSYEGGKFKKVFERKFADFYEDMRGIYIGNEFYVITDDFLYTFDIKTFEKLSELYF